MRRVDDRRDYPAEVPDAVVDAVDGLEPEPEAGAAGAEELSVLAGAAGTLFLASRESVR